MQITIDIRMSPEEYVQNFDEMKWPVLEVCPMCGAHASLKGHGFYQRNALLEKKVELVIKIKRVLCTICKKTASFLPSFLLPYYQHTVGFVVKSLIGKVKSTRQLLRHHWKRFLQNSNRVLAFFRDMGINIRLPEDEKERAMKLLENIESFVPETFSMLYRKHTKQDFMAN